MNNIEVFKDTLKCISENDQLKERTLNAVSKTYIADEGFISAKKPFYKISKVWLEENLTLITACRYAERNKKTAVLNFANPLEEGGGVLRGANAQEEYLCRASNLYSCLKSDNAFDYYRRHNELFDKSNDYHMFLGTDRIIYSPDVTVFKCDKGYNQNGLTHTQVYTPDWVNVDVITCAAPFFDSDFPDISEERLYKIFCSRIKNILEASIENEVEVLVLGAFGCGAFNNPPMLVAKAFYDVLNQKRYKNAFSKVIFAIKRSGVNCKNINSFSKFFKLRKRLWFMQLKLT